MVELKVGMYFRFAHEIELNRVTHVEPDNNVMVWQTLGSSAMLGQITTFNKVVESGLIAIEEDVCDACSVFQVPFIQLRNLTVCRTCWGSS